LLGVIAVIVGLVASGIHGNGTNVYVAAGAESSISPFTEYPSSVVQSAVVVEPKDNCPHVKVENSNTA
jgi:hypothetical protein